MDACADKIIVYISAPITGLSYEAALVHFAYMERILEATGKIVVRSPMRGKRTLSHQTMLKPGGYKRASLTDAALHRRDHRDVKQCDAVLCDLIGAKEKSTGCTHELAWSWIYQKFVVFAIEREGNPNDHGFNRQSASVIVHDTNEALLCLIEWADADVPEELAENLRKKTRDV